jgi:dihydrofolate reductase
MNIIRPWLEAARGDSLAPLWHNLHMLDVVNKLLKKEDPPIVIVAAMSKVDRGIGNGNQLLWHIPEDLKHFKALTLGHPIIMGRKTFESIVAMIGKPLPGRTSIVITRDEAYAPEGAHVARSLEEAILHAKLEHPKEIHIGGGAEIYRLALPLVSKLHITWIQDKQEADTFFPAFEEEFSMTKTYPTSTHKGTSYQWVDYERV